MRGPRESVPERIRAKRAGGATISDLASEFDWSEDDVLAVCRETDAEIVESWIVPADIPRATAELLNSDDVDLLSIEHIDDLRTIVRRLERETSTYVGAPVILTGCMRALAGSLLSLKRQQAQWRESRIRNHRAHAAEINRLESERRSALTIIAAVRNVITEARGDCSAGIELADDVERLVRERDAAKRSAYPPASEGKAGPSVPDAPGWWWRYDGAGLPEGGKWVPEHVVARSGTGELRYRYGRVSGETSMWGGRCVSEGPAVVEKEPPRLTFHEAWGEAADRDDYDKPAWKAAQARGESCEARTLGDWIHFVHCTTPIESMRETVWRVAEAFGVDRTCLDCATFVARIAKREHAPRCPKHGSSADRQLLAGTYPRDYIERVRDDLGQALGFPGRRAMNLTALAAEAAAVLRARVANEEDEP